MKIKVYPEKGETVQDVEDKLEKAVASKIKKREKAYAKESYHNDHLDQFHDMITEEHNKMLTELMEEIEDVLRNDLGVRRAGK